tara:strand:+ start:292 stop:756 length:465 start_codon:yes stop_codon:yes gene_type:complete
MSLKSKIESDYENSLKSKDKIEISTYRLILSGIKDLEISNRSSSEKKQTDDNDIKQLIKKMIKQRNESIEIYKKNNRADLQAVEEKEANILISYLPKQLSNDEIKDICQKTIEETNSQSIKDMGKVMAILKKNYSDSLDFSKAGAILKEILNKK